MKKILRLFPMVLLCMCVLTACSSDDGDGDGESNNKYGVYVINGHKFVDLGLPADYYGLNVILGLLNLKKMDILIGGEK